MHKQELILRSIERRCGVKCSAPSFSHFSRLNTNSLCSTIGYIFWESNGLDDYSKKKGDIKK